MDEIKAAIRRKNPAWGGGVLEARDRGKVKIYGSLQRRKEKG